MGQTNPLTILWAKRRAGLPNWTFLSRDNTVDKTGEQAYHMGHSCHVTILQEIQASRLTIWDIPVP